MEKLAQIGTVAAPVRRAGEVRDGRLKALYAVQEGMNTREIQKDQKTDKAINKNNTVEYQPRQHRMERPCGNHYRRNKMKPDHRWKDSCRHCQRRPDSQRQHSQRQRHLPQSRKQHQYPLFRKQEHNHRRLQSQKRKHRSLHQQRRLWNRRVLRERERTDRRNHPYPYPVRYHSKRYGNPFQRKRHPDPGWDSQRKQSYR